MADFTANFEAGINGNTITTGAGEASATAWDLVDGTPTYSNTHPAHGALCMKITDGADNNFPRWNTGTGTDHYGRFYFYATQNPPSECNVFKNNQDNTTNAFVALLTDGKVKLKDNGASHSQTSSNSIALNQWVRIEYHIICSATVGQMEVKFFNSTESGSPTETITTPSNWNTGATQNSYLFGDTDIVSWGADIWFDSIVANATSYPGPVNITPQILYQPTRQGKGAGW